ncbi:MAG: DUF4299 family protein [Oscillospiraceae bacterium]
MSVTFTVSQGGKLMKTKPSLAFLQKKFGSAYQIGGIGPALNFQAKPGAAPDGCEAAYMVYSAADNRLGRGFTLFVDKGYSAFRLESPVPTTIHDLEDMVAFAGILAGLVEVDRVHCGELGAVRAAGLARVFPAVRAANCAILKSYAIDRPGFMVSGVLYPLKIPESLCRRMADLPAENGALYFADYLAEKQWPARAYLAPTFHRNAADGTVAGTYTLLEDTAFVIPKTPFIPFDASPFAGEAVATWAVELLSNHLGVIGSMGYEGFLSRLDAREVTDFDELHYLLRALPLQRMRALLG